VLTYSLLALCHVVISVLRRPGSAAHRRFLISIAVVGAACVYLIHHDARAFVLFFFLPWCMTYLLAPVANWFQHVGCDATDPCRSANVNLSVVCGALGLNIGFHSAHHIKPALHWSKLASFHWEYVAPQIPDRFYRPVSLQRWQRRRARRDELNSSAL
jgi:beta-carotene hydroxylase